MLRRKLFVSKTKIFFLIRRRMNRIITNDIVKGNEILYYCINDWIYCCNFVRKYLISIISILPFSQQNINPLTASPIAQWLCINIISLSLSHNIYLQYIYPVLYLWTLFHIYLKKMAIFFLSNEVNLIGKYIWFD